MGQLDLQLVSRSRIESAIGRAFDAHVQALFGVMCANIDAGIPADEAGTMFRADMERATTAFETAVSAVRETAKCHESTTSSDGRAVQ